MNEIELKPCPFCGGKAKIKPNNIYGTPGLNVHCTTSGCHIHTMTIMYDCTYNQYGGEKNVFVTREMAETDLTRMWNRRVNNEQRETD